MDFDARDEIWNATFDTYYDAFYNETVGDRVVRRWQIVDDVTKVCVALTASGTAISGWTLWSDPNWKWLWAIFAGLGTVLSIVHSALGVPGRLKDWGDVKSAFSSLRVQLETFQYRMKVDPEFPVQEFTKELVQLRTRYGELGQKLKNDLLATEGLKDNAQNDVNEALRPSFIEPKEEK